MTAEDNLSKLPELTQQPLHSGDLPTGGNEAILNRETRNHMVVEPVLPPTPPRYKPRILIVDDDKTLLDTWKDSFRSTRLKDFARLEVFHYDSAAAYDSLLSSLDASIKAREYFDAVYIDLGLAESVKDAGIGVIRRLRADLDALRFIPFVAITAYPDTERQEQAKESGYLRFIVKVAPQSAADALGTIVQRMVLEATETVEQAEDEFWSAVNGRAADLLTKGQPWQVVAEDIVRFLGHHYLVKALYLRESEQRVLKLIAGNDELGIATPHLSIDSVPFINKFVRVDRLKPYAIIEQLSKQDLGPFHDRAGEHQVLMARIGVGGETLGLFTLYREPKARLFRAKDGQGLHHLAAQFAGAITAERQVHRLRERQAEAVRIVRQFDDAEDVDAIYSMLRDRLHELIGPTAKGGPDKILAVVRKILHGTNKIIFAVNPRGFDITRHEIPFGLDNTAGSMVARAISRGETEYEPDVSYANDNGRVFFLNSGTRCMLAMPMKARSVCLGAVCLEALQPSAFQAEDRDFAELLCNCAADTLIRLRVRAFSVGMARLFETLAEADKSSTRQSLDDIVRLLFEFTGFADLFYLEPPVQDNAYWTLAAVYQSRISGGPGRETTEARRADDPTLVRWANHVSENWHQSYIARVLREGHASGYTEQNEKIVPDNEVRMHDRDRRDIETRAQAVIVVRRTFNQPPSAIITLLFAHRHALNDDQLELLSELGWVLAVLLSERQRILELYGLQTLREQEALLGQAFGQFRHGLVGQLALIREAMQALDDGVMSLDDMKQTIHRVLRNVDGEIDRSKHIVKIPKPAEIDLAHLWEDCKRKLAAIALEYHGNFGEAKFGADRVTTDPDIIAAIVFNLVDNALRHGGPGVTVRFETARVGGEVHIDVIDDGRGVSDAVRGQIFQAGVTTSQISTGMGLYLAHKRAHDLGGDLELLRADRGAHFRIILRS